jgi:hypothetical protein
MRPWYGPIVNTVYGMTMVAVFVVNAVCYGAIYYRIKRAAKSTSTTSDSKYHKAAKLMMIFVAVYLFQWWTYVVQALWSFAGPPAVELYILSVVVINLGGVYNAIAYTIIRRKYASVGAAEGGSGGAATTNATQSSSLAK